MGPRSTMGLAVAYITQGTVRIKLTDGATRTLESPYGNTIHERAVRSQQKHSWKSAGDGFLSGPMLWGKSGAQTGPAPILFTSVSRGATHQQLVYTLASGTLSALCEADHLGTEERRLWNDNRKRIQFLSVCPQSGNIACSVLHENGTSNIGVMIRGEPGFGEVTEGDSVDTAPQWVPGQSGRIVYQSAGVGRDRHGNPVTLGPFSIQAVKIESAELETLAEDPFMDFVAPRLGADGTLYFIRRPYNEHTRVKPLRVLKETLLFPFRLFQAVMGFLNLFSMFFTGKKLSTPSGTPRHHVELRDMMVWGNLVQAERSGAENESADLVPSSWQLVRRAPAGEETILAKGVLAYDMNADGVIAYSNGNAIFVIGPDGRRERIAHERMIEQVVIL